MFKNQLTPLRKGGEVTKHAGKGSKTAPMVDRAAVVGAQQPGAGLNNFSKATPMAAPAPNPAMPGPGSGGFPGNGF